jgi:predicted metal-binding membrane protein
VQQTTPLEAVLKRDRSLIVAGLFLVVALSWAYMVQAAWDMPDMAMGGRDSANAMKMAMAQVMHWSTTDFVLTIIMWAIMMMAMMVPAAAPMVLLFATINRKHHQNKRPFMATGVFLSGYLVIWWGFSILATIAQWGLHQAAMLSSMMGSVSPILGGSLLIVAGIFQWTPLKSACLKHCRSPLDHLVSHWRDGARGAFLMGVEHGIYCLGCCWFLMGLMFTAGVMNLAWMGGIAVYVLLEKVLPQHRWSNVVTWATGAGMVAWGVWMILTVPGS